MNKLKWVWWQAATLFCYLIQSQNVWNARLTVQSLELGPPPFES
jgi:hypothetical protein